MSLPDKCYCKRCARKMVPRTLGKDAEGRPYHVYYCIACDPVRSGAQEAYELCMGIEPRRRRRRW
jgi:hypothetical protein